MKKKIVYPIAAVLVAVVVTAALITYFGQVNTEINVEQAVSLTGTDCADNQCDTNANISGGETHTTEIYSLTSITSVPAPIELVNSIDPSDAGIDIWNQFILDADSSLYITGEDAGLNTLGDLDTIDFTVTGDSVGIILYFDSTQVQFNTSALDDTSSDGNKTLAEWKSSNGTDIMVGIELISLGTQSEIQDVEINNINKELPTIMPGEMLKFLTKAQFQLGHVGTYNLRTQVDIR